MSEITMIPIVMMVVVVVVTVVIEEEVVIEDRVRTYCILTCCLRSGKQQFLGLCINMRSFSYLSISRVTIEVIYT